MKPINLRLSAEYFAGPIFMVAFAASALMAQQYPPPQNQQYPPTQNPYGQPGQNPADQGQYPSQQGQYPPTQYPPTPNGQYPPPQGNYSYAAPPMLAPQQLDQMVGPIALYPDGLLAQVLTASTFYQEIPDAAGYANQHSYLHGPALAQAIQQDNLPFDPSVVALIPFPNVLNQMANDMGWTQALGNAVLSQRPQVMDAVQRMRSQAYQYGYLHSNDYERVVFAPGDIEIVPAQPDLFYVPYYNPYVVYTRPRPGFFVGGAISFGPRIALGASFAPWGWGGGVGFGWSSHTIIYNNHPWVRTWNNRAVYAYPGVAPHPYESRERYQERHELRGPAHYEEHHDRGHENEHH